MKVWVRKREQVVMRRFSFSTPQKVASGIPRVDAARTKRLWEKRREIMKNVPLTVAAFAIVGSTAMGAVTTTAVDRFNLTEYDVAFTGPTTVQNDGSAFGLFDNLTEAFYWEGDAGGSSYADQETTIGTGSFGGMVDAAANTQGNGSGFSFHGAQSHFSVIFSVSTASDYTLDGWVNAWGTINGEHSVADFSLINTDTNMVISATSTDTDFIAFSESGVLAAGNYELIADATSWVDRTFETGFGDATSTVNFSLNIVPAPSSIALLGFGGLVSIRRRR